MLLFGIPVELVKSPSATRVTIRCGSDPSKHASVNLTGVEEVPAPTSVGFGDISEHYSPCDDGEGQEQITVPLIWAPGTQYKAVPLQMPQIVVDEPGLISVEVTRDERTETVGAFECTFVKPAALAAEEREAIMSRPGAVRQVRMLISCKQCKDAIDIRESLDPQANRRSHTDPAIVWLADAPDKWTCSCGSTSMPLTYLKAGMHDMFRTATMATEHAMATYQALYEEGALSAVLAEYEKLISGTPEEQEVQRFLEQNAVLWNFLAPARIWHKPRILGQKVADFGVLSRQDIFHLIEIEKPQTRLFTAKGKPTAELEEGFQQLRDWKDKIDHHRAAALECLGIPGRDVEIRFILIAGRWRDCKPGHLPRFRRTGSPVGPFICFDELAGFLHSTVGVLRQL
jgi:hypothetical protein